MQVQEGDQPPHPPHLSGQGVFLWLWPLFARAPRHWFLENFLLSAPGVQSVFFFVALRWAPRPFGGARAKKKTPPRVFFCSGPGERQGKEKPRWKPARGQQKNKKKKTPWVVFFFFAPHWDSLTAGLGGDFLLRRDGVFFFFCCGPARTGVVFFFFLLWPRPDAHSLTVGWGDFGKARVVFFFAVAPPGRFRQ